MKVECMLKRDGGSRVRLGGQQYHFAPQADGAHVAEVDDAQHVAVLLGVPEAYRLYVPVATGAVSARARKQPAPAAQPAAGQADSPPQGD